MVAVPAVKLGRIYWLFGRWRQVVRRPDCRRGPQGQHGTLTLSDPNPKGADVPIPASDRRAALERGMFPPSLARGKFTLRRPLIRPQKTERVWPRTGHRGL